MCCPQMAPRKNNRVKGTVAGVLLLVLSATAAGALDVNDLAPCRPAATRFCDHSEGMTRSNLGAAPPWPPTASESAMPVGMC